MSPETLEIDKVLFEHRQQVNYWQSMHARAVDREALWKQKAQELEALVRGQAVQLQEQAGQVRAEASPSIQCPRRRGFGTARGCVLLG